MKEKDDIEQGFLGEGKIPPFPEEVSPHEKIEDLLARLEEKKEEISEKEVKKEEVKKEEEEFTDLERMGEEEILIKKPKRKKLPKTFIKFAIIGFIVCGIGGLLFLGKDYYKPILINAYKPVLSFINTKLLKPSCDLIVSSNPTEADLFVDDIVKGKTPITIKKLPFGDHNVRIEKEGFKPWIGSISVTSRKPINITANLEKEEIIKEEIVGTPTIGTPTIGTATLIVKTNPKDSLIYIDGKREKMPYILLAGTYSIKVIRDGFKSSIRTIYINEGEVKKVFITLKPLCGSVFIDSTPRRADVVFDGSFRGKTPLILTNLSPWKPFKITIKKEGYFNWKGMTFVEPNKRTKIIAFLKKEDDTKEEVSQRLIFQIPIREEKKEGIWKPISPSYEGPYFEWKPLDIPKKKPESEITGAFGRCFITSIPAGADIFLDGKFIGKTPIRDFVIEGGKYQLKASLPGFKEEEKEIVVLSGERVNFFNFSLKK